VKVTIDSDLCTGHGRCYSLSPTVFDSDDDGNGRVILNDLDELDDAQLAASRVAVANCPEQAISITP
jgi:ferredoxin